MTAPLTPVQDSIFIAVRAFILSLIDCEVVQGLGNRVPTPKGGYIAITAGRQTRLSTNVSSDNGVDTRSVLKATAYALQIDCYGPLSSDWATIIETMWRDPYGCNALAPDMAPLYCDDPTNLPLVDGEDEYEQRWMISATMQFNPVVTVVQEFASALDLDLVSVDATFPP